MRRSAGKLTPDTNIVIALLDGDETVLSNLNPVHFVGRTILCGLVHQAKLG
jgi:hypothetical protein